MNQITDLVWLAVTAVVGLAAVLGVGLLVLNRYIKAGQEEGE